MKEVKIVEFWATFDSPKGARQHAEQRLTELVNHGWEIKTAVGGAGRNADYIVDRLKCIS